MIGFINMLLGADMEILLGDLYQPVCAAVAASWAILAFAAVCGVFTHLFAAVIGVDHK